MLSKDLSVVIHTCDQYSFIWERFIEKFVLYFPSGYYPIYFCNEEVDVTLPSYIQQIKTGIDTWPKRLQTALNQIPTANILYFQEDYILNNLVDRSLLERCLQLHINNNNDITKLGTFFEFQVEHFDNLDNYPIYIQYPESQYIISHQPTAIFNTKFVYQTLQNIKSHWEHEVLASAKIQNGNMSCKCWCIGNIYNPNKPSIIEYDHVVRNGQIVA